MAFEKDYITRLYVGGESGECLEIAPNPDAPEVWIILHTPNPESERWFGKINLVLSPEECKALGDALADYAIQFEARKP